jgi:hypothetical protein
MKLQYRYQFAGDALGFLEQQSAGIRKTVILSDFLQSALPDEALYELVAEKLIRHKVNKLIAIGDKISSTLSLFLSGPDISEVSYYKNTQEFTESFRHSQFRDEAILVGPGYLPLNGSYSCWNKGTPDDFGNKSVSHCA